MSCACGSSLFVWPSQRAVQRRRASGGSRRPVAESTAAPYGGARSRPPPGYGGHVDERQLRKKHDKELIELLNELRVALPGVQVLFAFLLVVPFSTRFDVDRTEKSRT